jgi:hypothetical protein
MAGGLEVIKTAYSIQSPFFSALRNSVLISKSF